MFCFEVLHSSAENLRNAKEAQYLRDLKRKDLKRKVLPQEGQKRQIRHRTQFLKIGILKVMIDRTWHRTVLPFDTVLRVNKALKSQKTLNWGFSPENSRSNKSTDSASRKQTDGIRIEMEEDNFR